MGNHKYILELYKGQKSRYHCPQCGKEEFTRYINTDTKEYLSDRVGKCNRINHCGYHYSPKQFFQDNNFLIVANTKRKRTNEEGTFTHW